VGDKVVLPTMGFTKFPFDNEEYYVGPENQILARIKTEG
jgi:co-chaperonin GroES (HSP10)